MTLPLDGRRLHSRVRGRQSLERRLRGLLVAVNRFGEHRAQSAADRLWAAAVIDGLKSLLNNDPHVASADDANRRTT